MKTIYINENKLQLLKESEDEVTYYAFECALKGYLKELLDNPLSNKSTNFFKENNISDSLLKNKMLDMGLLKKKKEGFDEPMDADGNKHSVHYMQYSVNPIGFEKKSHALYDTFFSNGERKTLTEDGECAGCDGGSIGGGATTCDGSSGQYTVPFGTIKRKNIYNTKKIK